MEFRSLVLPWSPLRLPDDGNEPRLASDAADVRARDAPLQVRWSVAALPKSPKLPSDDELPKPARCAPDDACTGGDPLPSDAA